MGISTEQKIISMSANFFQMELEVNVHDVNDITHYTTQIDINSKIEFQAMLFDLNRGSANYLVKCTKKQKNDKQTYKVSLYQKLIHRSDTHKVSPLREYTTEVTSDGNWHSVADRIKMPSHGNKYKYLIALKTDIAPLLMSCGNIHQDTDFTDLELHGVDGSVHIHKAVAAACSPFFCAMIKNTWRETVQGVVEVPETSVTTLQHLKDYMYLGTLPESDDLKQLLLLSSCYMMPDLEMRCLYYITARITTETAYDMMQFAAKHNFCQLMIAIVEMVKHNHLSLDEIKTYNNCY